MSRGSAAAPRPFGKAHPCLLVAGEAVAPWSQLENPAFARVSVGVSLPTTCLSSPCVSCNLADMRGAPSDSPLLGPLDSPG